jgi:hypothetical protein
LLRPASETELENGIVTRDVMPGDMAGVQLLYSAGPFYFLADGSISPGQTVFRAADGKVSATGTSRLGRAQSGASDGHYVLVVVEPGAGGGGGGSGTVEQINTGEGLLGGPIVVSGTISLAPPTAGQIGGVKAGANISIDPDGTINATGGVGTVVEIETGEGLTGGPITSSGTISLVPPSGSNIGGVKAGTNITIAGDGTISSTASGTGTVTQVNTGVGLQGGPITVTGTLSLKAAGASVANLGGVYQGDNITIESDGRISTLPAQEIYSPAHGLTASDVDKPIGWGSNGKPVVQTATNQSQIQVVGMLQSIVDTDRIRVATAYGVGTVANSLLPADKLNYNGNDNDRLYWWDTGTLLYDHADPGEEIALIYIGDSPTPGRSVALFVDHSRGPAAVSGAFQSVVLTATVDDQTVFTLSPAPTLPDSVLLTRAGHPGLVNGENFTVSGATLTLTGTHPPVFVGSKFQAVYR